MFKRIFVTSFCLLVSYLPGHPEHLTAAGNTAEMEQFVHYNAFSTPWVDSVFHSLTLEERIAQLLMIRVHTDKKPARLQPASDYLIHQLLIDKKKTYFDSINEIIENYNIGGIAFFRGTPKKQLKITNIFQDHARTPLFIAMDAEWGLGMRLDSTISYPKQMTLGALTDNRLIYKMGIEVARQLKRIGVHINFAPVVDVNSNPLNPVINFRSFGECRYNVSQKSIAYMTGMQDWGIIANAKHFPGHGDTYTDSHYTLPVINNELVIIDSLHLYPFKRLFESGVKSVMTAHLHIPAYDNTENLASTLSKNVVTHLLQNELGFKGLVITDALDMKGVSDYFEPGELELKALIAGNDILLLPEDVPAAINTIKEAIENGEISESYLNYKCRKVLFFKEMAGLDNYRPSYEHNLYKDLNTINGQLINKKLIENSVTLIKNTNDLLPLTNLDTLNIASLAIGADSENTYQKYLNKYYPIDKYNIPRNFNNSQLNELVEKLNNYNLIIVSLHNNSIFQTANYGINGNITNLLQYLAEKNNVILNLFANPYVLNYFDSLASFNSIMISYEDGCLFEKVSAQVIFGGIPARGVLPVSATPLIPVGTGIETHENFRVQFASPEEAGVSSNIRSAIDSIVEKGISGGAYPGAQVVVIKDGNVIVNKSYGYHTYEKYRKVKNSDIYDVASLTKIAATTAAIMHLKSNKLIDIDKTIDFYLPWLKDSSFEGLRLREILAHQARLQSWIPFYLETIDEDYLDSLLYRGTYCDDYPVRVAENMFIRKDYRDTIYNKILKAPLIDRQRYLYSDLGFYILADLVKEVSGSGLDEYVNKYFSKPMGLQTMAFNPLEKFDSIRIVPSEKGTLFRRQIIRGHVNDPGAAMLGGVSGHAGLFSNALDMAVIMQMFLQNGSYGGQNYIDESILTEFTTSQFGNNNRRGLGFDKPGENHNGFPACKSASPESFGHTGFTGTYAWADPKENLVFVFLSNRVYPFASNRKLIDMNIRSEILQTIYDSINKIKYIETQKIQ